MDRAYSVLEIKATSDTGGKRTFSGIATTPSTDRMGDIVEPKGAVFKLPIPLLWQHDSSDPIGWITSAKVTDKGITVEGEIASIEEEGPLKARLLTAWQMLKAKLVRGLSIGFNSIEAARIGETYTFRFMKWEWLELSAVTIPANQDATITAVKSIDKALLAASGHKQGPSGQTGQPPGATGTKAASRGTFNSQRTKGNAMKTLNEQLNELRTARAEKQARMNEIDETVRTEKRATTDEEADEFDALVGEIRDLDDMIRQKTVEAMNASSARSVKGQSSSEGSASRGPTILVRSTDPEDSFQGQSYVRQVIAKSLAALAIKEGNFVTPAQIAQNRWGKTHPKLVEFIRAGVAAGGTGSGEWGAELAQSDTRYTGDFVEFLYSKTVFDELPLRPVPERVHIKGQDGASTGYWVGESKAIPVTTADFSDVELNPLKVGAIAAISKALLRSSSPSAEMFLRDSLAEASAQRVDTTFLGSAAAVAGVSPAGLLNGLTPLAPSGADAAAIRADLMALYLPFLAAKNASGLVQIMTPSMAKAISLMVNALGQTEFPNLNSNGGTLLGDAVYTGDNVGAGNWFLMKPSDIWKIGDTGVEVSMSDVATIEQDSAPTGAGDTPTAASATLMSMFQTEQVAFKVVRGINYAKRRAGAVTVLSNAEYGGVVS